MISDNNIAVLICTFNGSKFLRKQLDSIISQTYTSWEIFASDDGSTDDTLDILKEYQARLGKGRCEQVPDMRSSYSSGAHPRGTS